MFLKLFRKLFFFALFFISAQVWGQISLTALNTAYTQNFDGSNMSASSCPCSTLPTGWSLSETGSNLDNAYAANSGTATTGDTYNYYSGSGTEFSLGGLASNNLQTRFGAIFTNNTGSTINELEISYKGEFWRCGATNAIDQLDFSYSLDATAIGNGTWVDVDNLDFVDDGLAANCKSSVGNKNGNATCFKNISYTITGLNITNGSSFFIRWVDLNITGADNGLSVDDFSLTPKSLNNLCAAPATQASNITFPSVGQTQMDVNWTNGDGAGRVVIMNTANSFTAPANGSNPTANTTYGGSGAQVVFNGTGSGPITITGLTASTTYYFRVYEYCSPDRVYQTAGATNNPNSQITNAPPPVSEINVQGNGQNIADGDITPSTTDHTDFGSVNVGSSLVRTFTIQNVNTATANLILSGSPIVAISGSSDFSVTLQPSSTNIAPNSSVTFQVTFTPTGTGAKTADISISNNDIDENPYNFRIGGEAVPACVAPNAVTNITLTPSGGSVSGTIDAPSGGATGYLVVRNATASLATTPTNATTYTVGNAFGTGTVAYFGTATNFTDNGLLPSTTYHYFVFPYNNTACFGGPVYNTIGYTENTTTLTLPYQAFDNFDRANSNTVGIPSSGGSNSWVEDEAGTSCSQTNSIIRVNNNALEISNCDLSNTGSCGGTLSKFVSFDITGKYPTTFNTASSTLEWYFNMQQSRINPSGLDVGNYGVAFVLGANESNLKSTTVDGYAVVLGESGTTDPVRLVHFTNGISNSSITTIISANGGGADVGNEHLSIKATYNPNNNQWGLLVRNDGSSFADPTTISGTPVTATNTTYVSTSLPFIGAYWQHNSSCEEIAKFDNINIPAQQLLPEIQVEYTTNNAVNIADGGSYNFGPILESGSNSYTATFTITNLGTANLALGTIGVSGGNASDFTVTQPSSNNLLPNATTTFTVTFNPSAVGNRTTILSFTTNDADENPFNFTLNGEGTNIQPLINEFVADVQGTGTYEFIEVYGNGNTNYSDLTLLVIEGDGGGAGLIKNVFPLGTTNANGYWVTSFLNNQIENGSQTYFLVKDFTGVSGQDLDTNNDGVLDSKPWNRILDAIAYRENATTDKVYSTVFFTATFQGFSPPVNVGGASRIPNGINTGSTADWQRNEYSGFGIPGFNVATPDSREAINTPGKANTPYNVWTGAISSAWNVAGNWTVGVPTLANELDAIIVNVANDPVFPIGGYNAFARYLVFENNSSLNMQLGDLSASANVLFANNVNVSNGTLILNGTQAQTLTANNISLNVLEINNSNGVTIIEPSVINIFEKLNLQSGTLTIQNLAKVNLKSTSTRTAYIDDFTSGYNGTITTNNNLTIERYIPALANPLSATPFAYLNRYFYIGSITNNITTASKWNGQFSLNANAGANNSNTVTPKTDCSREALAQGSPFSNLLAYDESRVQGDCYLRGWVPLNASATIERGKGYAARINDPAIINSNRLLSETGNYSKLPVTFNNLSISANNNSASLYSGQFGTKGHHIISNPFWAPIDWRVVATNNASVYGTAYKFNPETGNFLPLNNSGVVPVEIGTNEAIIILPLDANQSSYNVTIPATARVNSNSNSLLRQQQSYKYKLEVVVQSADNESDKAYLIFDNSFTENHDNGFDAKKMFSSIGVPSIYTKDLNNERSSILALPENTRQTTIPLGVAIEYNGNHTLTFEGIEDFPNTSIMWLEDLQTGSIQYLRDNNVYSFTANINDNADRFLLHFTPEMLISATDANCDNENGNINLIERGGLEWTYTVTDAANNTITNGSVNGGQETVSQLPSGTYTLQLTNTISGYQTTETVTVNQVATVSAAISTQSTQVNVGDVVTVDISNTTGATNTSVDMGDGTVYNNESIINHSYIIGGNYTITVNANNDNCADTATLKIEVMDIATSIANNKGLSIEMYISQNNLYVTQHLQEGLVDTKVEVYNMLGQIVTSKTINAQYQKAYGISLSEVAKGTYIARVIANGKTSSKRIIISE